MTTKADSNPVKDLRWSFFRKLLSAKETNSKSCQTSKMKLLPMIVENWKPISTDAKTSTLDVWKGFEYASELASKCTSRMLHF